MKSKICSCCGKRLNKKEREANEGITEGALCEECIEYTADLKLRRMPTDRIREKLSEENKEKWDSLTKFQKLEVCSDLLEKGVIEIKGFK